MQADQLFAYAKSLNSEGLAYVAHTDHVVLDMDYHGESATITGVDGTEGFIHVKLLSYRKDNEKIYYYDIDTNQLDD